jgi:SAM-dependent methyltransferase
MAFYDSRSQEQPTAVGTKINSLLYQNLSKIILPHLSQLEVLELGIGNGGLGKIIKPYTVRYVGIDANAASCKERKKEGFQIIRSLIPPIPVKKESFDFIIAMNLIEHMVNSNQVMFLFQDIFRALKSNGKLMIMAPDFLGWQNRFYAFDHTHNYPTTMRRLQLALYDCGFKTIKTKRFYGCFSGIAGKSLFLLSKMYPSGMLEHWFGISNPKLLKPGIMFLPNLFILAQKN